MKTIVIQTPSNAEYKFVSSLLKRLGFPPISDEEMAMPGPKVSKAQMERWLSEDDGPAFTSSQMKTRVKSAISKSKRTTNGSGV